MRTADVRFQRNCWSRKHLPKTFYLNTFYARIFSARARAYLHVFLKLIVTVDMDSGEFADFVELEFDLDHLTVPRIVSPTDPSLT